MIWEGKSTLLLWTLCFLKLSLRVPTTIWIRANVSIYYALKFSEVLREKSFSKGHYEKEWWIEVVGFDFIVLQWSSHWVGRMKKGQGYYVLKNGSKKRTLASVAFMTRCIYWNWPFYNILLVIINTLASSSFASAIFKKQRNRINTQDNVNFTMQ